jgi:hypothetical protein
MAFGRQPAAILGQAQKLGAIGHGAAGEAQRLADRRVEVGHRPGLQAGD